MIQPERLTFGQIANLWAQEPQTYPFRHLLKEPLSRANHGEATKAVLQELVSAVWRGEFEQSGESILTLPFPPGVQEQHGRWVNLAKIGQRPPEWIKNPLEHPGEKEKEKHVEAPVYAPCVSPPHIEFTRDDLRQGLQQSNWCEPDIAEAGFDVLANLPIDFYPPEFRETCLERLSITKADLRHWCKHHDLSPPIFSIATSAKSRGRKPDSQGGLQEVDARPDQQGMKVPKPRGRGGRKPGSGAYTDQDRVLWVKMKAALDGGDAVSPWDAAGRVVERAPGRGNDDSKKRRLVKGYSDWITTQ